MSYLVANPEDMFSRNEAQTRTENSSQILSLYLLHGFLEHHRLKKHPDQMSPVTRKPEDMFSRDEAQTRTENSSQVLSLYLLHGFLEHHRLKKHPDKMSPVTRKPVFGGSD